LRESLVQRNPLSLIRTLSIDIVAGVLAVSYYFCRLFSTTLPHAYWISLGAAVWFIYLADHLADTHLPGNYSNKAELLALRDLRKLITRCLLVSLLILFVSLFFLPGKIILYGFIGGVFVVTYLIINQIQNHTNRSFFSRELVISLLYCLGTAGIPYLYGTISDRYSGWFLSAFFLLILTNTLIFALTHYTGDVRQGVKSLAVILNYRNVRILALLSGIMTCANFGWLIAQSPYAVYGFLGLMMATTLLFLWIFLNKLSDTFIEMLADGILILPAVLLFI
jgi:4-hydroxybenzoate polyprenyltransferase